MYRSTCPLHEMDILFLCCHRAKSLFSSRGLITVAVDLITVAADLISVLYAFIY
jgi:hypothetical protein